MSTYSMAKLISVDNKKDRMLIFFECTTDINHRSFILFHYLSEHDAILTGAHELIHVFSTDQDHLECM